MKIEIWEKENYHIFINKCYAKDVDLSAKEQLIVFIKEVVLRLKSRLNLRGFYKVKVFPNARVGVFLELLKLDDLDISNGLDLRVIVFQEEEIYFETEDYYIIENCNNKRYLDGKFYCVVDDSFEEILEKVEFGRFIYGKEAIHMLNKSLAL